MDPSKESEGICSAEFYKFLSGNRLFKVSFFIKYEGKLPVRLLCFPVRDLWWQVSQSVS